jgi:hypothetical protein
MSGASQKSGTGNKKGPLDCGPSVLVQDRDRLARRAESVPLTFPVSRLQDGRGNRSEPCRSIA